MDQDKLLQAVDIIEMLPGEIKPVKNIAYHSGRTSKGSLFVSIKGYKTDRHRYQ